MFGSDKKSKKKLYGKEIAKLLMIKKLPGIFIFFLLITRPFQLHAIIPNTDWIGTSCDLIFPTNWTSGVPDSGTNANFGTSSCYGPSGGAFPISAYSLTFTGNNNYTFGITNAFDVYAGGIVIVPPLPPNIIFNISGVLNFHNCSLDAIEIQVHSSGTLRGTMGGSNATVSLGLSGNGNLILDGESTFGFLSSGSVGDSIKLNGNLIAVGYLGFASTILGTISDGTVAGGQFVKVGNGTLTLAGTNTYTGDTTISGGTLQVVATGNIPDSGFISFVGGDVLDTTTGVTIPNFIFLYTNGTINVESGTTTLSKPIADGGDNSSLSKTGDGTLVLSNSNTYSGGTNFLGGIIKVSAANNIPNRGTITFNGGQVLNTTTGGFIIPNHITLTTIGRIQVDSGTTTLSGTIDGPSALEKTGNGTLALSGTNSYGGGTGIFAGNLQVSAVNNIAPSGVIVFSFGNILDTTTGDFTIPNDMSGTNVTINVNSNTTTLSGQITGTGFSLTKTGNGTLALSNNSNNYTGGTNINGGTLQVSAAGIIPSGSGTITFTGPSTLALDTRLGGFTIPNAITLTANGSVDGNTANVGILSGQITGVGFSLTKTGSGTLALSNNTNSYNGGTNINGGALQVSANNVIPNIGIGTTITFTGPSTLALDTGLVGLNIPNAITLTANGSVNVNSTNNIATLSGAIGGAGSLTKTESGTLLLTHSNSYGGGTNINGGTLQVSSGGRIPITGNITFTSPSTLDTLSGNFDIPNDITLTASGTFNVNNNSVDLNGNISGAGALTKTGLASLSLSGSNTYLGGTSINGGILEVSSDGNISPFGIITFNGGQKLDTTTGNLAIPNDIDLITSGIVNVDSNTTTLGGSITGAGALTKTGNGTLTLSGANSYLGDTIVSAGTLQGDSSSLQGAILNNASVVFNQTTPGSYTGNMSGNGSLTKTGNGTLTLSNNTNSYNGGTNINGGTLQVPGANVIPNTGTITFTGPSTLALDTRLGGFTIPNAITLTANGSVDGNTANVGILSGQITGVGFSLTKTGSGTLALSNNTNSYNGGTNINGGTLQVPAANVIPNIGIGTTITFTGPSTLALDTGLGGFTIPNAITFTANGSVDVNTGNVGILSGQITGGGFSLTKTGNGTLALSNNTNSYNGGTNINGGTLQVPAANVIPNTGTITFTGPSTLALDTGLGGFAIPNAITLTANGSVNVNTGNAGILSGQITGVGFSLTKTGSGTLALSNNTNSYNGGTNIIGGILQVSASNIIPTSGTITLSAPGPNELDTQNGGILIPNPIVLSLGATVNVNANTTTLSGAINGGGGLLVTGGGKLVLSGTNSYSGGTTISGVSTLEGTTSSLQGAITDNGELFFNQSTSGTFNGTVSGLGFFEKFGSGTVTLTGANSSGFAIIFNGGLKVNGTFSSTTTFDVEAGTTLSGVGTITANPILINGNLQPGNSIGTMNMAGPVTLGSSSNYLVEFNGTNCDLLNVTGSVTIQPGASVTLQVDQIVANSTVYPIITATSPISGTFTTFNNPSHFLNAQLSYSANQVLLLLSRKSFASILPNNAPSNAIAVGLALEQVNPSGGSDLDNIVNLLMMSTSSDVIIHDLLQMQPSQLKALGVSATNTTMQMHSMIADHANSYLKTRCSLWGRKKWEVWTDVFGNFSHQSKLRGEMGFHDETGGFLIGIDACPVKNLCVGIATAYTLTHLAWNENPSKANIQNGYGILYASWYSSHFFVTSSLTAAYDHTQANRSIILFTSDLNRTAKSSFSGIEASSFIEMDGIFQQGSFQFLPFASLHYCYLHQNHFNEKGAIGLNLKVDEANADLLRSEAGLKVSYCHRIKDREWIPKLGISVVEENRFKGKYYHAEFLENPGVFFTVKGLRPNHTLVSPKASVQLKKGEHLSWVLAYEGEFGWKYHNNRAHFFMNYSF